MQPAGRRRIALETPRQPVGPGDRLPGADERPHQHGQDLVAAVARDDLVTAHAVQLRRLIAERVGGLWVWKAEAQVELLYFVRPRPRRT